VSSKRKALLDDELGKTAVSTFRRNRREVVRQRENVRHPESVPLLDLQIIAEGKRRPETSKANWRLWAGCSRMKREEGMPRKVDGEKIQSRSPKRGLSSMVKRGDQLGGRGR